MAEERLSGEGARGPISRETAERYAWGQGCDGWHLVRTAGLSVIEERMPPGTSEVRHFHRRSRQFFYVLSGRLMIEVSEGSAGRRWELTARMGLEIAPGVVHQVRNVGAEDAEFVVVSQPPSHGDRELVGEA